MPAPPPPVHITVHRLFDEPRDLTLAYPLAAEHDELLRTIYREYGGRGAPDGQVIEDRMHPRLPRATPGHPGGWLTLAQIPDPRRGATARRWRLAHWPGSGLPGGHDVPARMSREHAEDQEYTATRIDEHGGGVAARLEVSVTARTRSDVAAIGPDGHAVATFEIQYSGIHPATAVRRDRAVARAGIPATWLGPTDSRPSWFTKVAWLGANRRDGLARGSWTLASGRQHLEMEPCRPGARQDCPLGRSWCGDVHPLWRPRGGTVDDVVHGVLDGTLVRFDTGRRIVVASPADVQRWVDYYGTPRNAQRVAAARKLELVTPSVTHNALYGETKIRAGMPGDAAADRLADAAGHAWPVTGTTCATCGMPLIVCKPGQRHHPGCEPAAHQPAAPPPPEPPAEPVVPKLRPAEQMAVDLARAARTVDDLHELWRLSTRAGSATEQLRDACRERKAQLLRSDA